MQTEKSKTLPVVVVGAGIVGASIAYHLAKSGLAVTVVEKSSTTASGATGASFAWIGKPGGQDRPNASIPLRKKIIDDWISISEELPDITVRWTGSILWSGSFASGDFTPISGEQEFLNGSEVLAKEPLLRTPPERALHNVGDGAVDPIAVTESFLNAARDRGANVLTDTNANALIVRDGAASGVETSSGDISAQTVVIAAGAEAVSLLNPVGVSIPLAPSPALLFKFSAPPELIRTIIWGEEVEARQMGDGLMLVPVEYQGETTEQELLHTANETRQRIARTFVVDQDDLQLVDKRIGYRPMPTDGLPLIGPLKAIKNVYIAVMHSGVSLAPTAGRLIATELTDGVEVEELCSLRPER